MPNVANFKSGFIGDRLKEARESRGINGRQLAEGVGLTKQAISNYENGDRAPTTELWETIAKWLRFPRHRFTLPMPTKSECPLFFRSFSTALKGARVRAERRIDMLRNDICEHLGNLVEFPKPNFPAPNVPEDPVNISFEFIEQVAKDARKFWNLGSGPISDVVLLFENNGAIVVRQELGTDALDAFSRVDPIDNRPYVVIGTDRTSGARSRFSAAHEIGHLILHRHLDRNLVSSHSMHRLLESQANRFAGAFMLPEESFGEELVGTTLQSFVMIKTRWRVSIQAMIMRCKQLEFINDTEEERLFAGVAKNGWRKKEIYDDEIAIERPRFIERAFDLVLNDGVATRDSIVGDTALFAPDIESIAGLDDGFFGDEVENYKFPRLNGTEN